MIRILLLAILLISAHVSAASIQWMPLGATTLEGRPAAIEGLPIIEYRNAGIGGIDWIVTGSGPRGGAGVQELWLLDNSAGGVPGTSKAETTFSVISNSVSFFIKGDHNDGFAQFFVDGVDVGTFDLHQIGRSSLVVTGLNSIAHSLSIVQLGEHNPLSGKGDVAIIGGAAFNTASISVISEPSILSLFFISFLYFIGQFFNKRAFRLYVIAGRFST